MICGDGNKRAAAGPRALQVVQQDADLRVDEGDLAIVRPLAESCLERVGRLVWRVRIEEVDPQEQRPLGDTGILAQPRVDGGDRLVRAPFDRGRTRRIAAARESIVVPLESAGEAESPLQRKSGDERLRSVPAITKSIGERRNGASENEPDVVVDAVTKRCDACKQ